MRDEYQGPRRRLGEAQAIDHFGGRQPMIVLYRLLSHVAQDRIGAAEGDDRKLREEERDLAEHMMPSEARYQNRDRNDPEGEPQGRRPHAFPPVGHRGGGGFDRRGWPGCADIQRWPRRR